MAGFLFRLETKEGAGRAATASERRPGLGPGARSTSARTLRVVGKRDDDADQAPVLVVEEVA